MATIIGIILVIVGLVALNCAGYIEADDSTWGGLLSFFFIYLICCRCYNNTSRKTNSNGCI